MPLPLINIHIESLLAAFGFGVAGNFAGHLEQAGEARDFVNVAAHAEMPKGIFPWYVPGNTSFLGAFPLASSHLAIPAANDEELRIQIEPEVGVYCAIERDTHGVVTGLTPQWVAAFDDCSWRKANATKISEKKNWGAGSKGLAPQVFEVHDIESEGAIATLRLASFLTRDGETHRYGVDSAVASYTLCGEELLQWLVDRLRNQRGMGDTPLEDVGTLLDGAAPPPTHVVIGIGATRYEPFGETTFVQPGDDAIVVLYDAQHHSPDAVFECIAAGETPSGASVLRRRAAAQTTSS